MSVPSFDSSPSRQPTNEEETVRHPATAPFVQFKIDDTKRILLDSDTVTLAANQRITYTRDEAPDYWIVAIPNRNDDEQVSVTVGNVTFHAYPGESVTIPAYGERLDLWERSGTSDVDVQIIAARNVKVKYNPPKLAAAGGGGDSVSIVGSVPLEVINDSGTTLDVDIASSVPLSIDTTTPLDVTFPGTIDVSGSTVDASGSTVAISGTVPVSIGTSVDTNPLRPSTSSEGNVSVATAATQIRPATVTRHVLIIRNIGTNNIYYASDATVTTASGMQLEPGESAVIEHQDIVYAIADTSATNVRYSEETY